MIQPIKTNPITSTNNTKQGIANGNAFQVHLKTAQTTTDRSDSSQSTPYDAIFERASKTYNVPVHLLKAVAKAESNYNPKAVSHCGAQGVMQLMPKTAKSLGVTNAFDPEQNIMGGAKYLGSLLKTYNQDVKLTLAAYNAGSGNVKKYGGIPPFAETKKYVEKILKDLNNNLPTLSTSIQSTPIVPTQLQSPAPIRTIQSLSAPDLSASLNTLSTTFDESDYQRLLRLISELKLNDAFGTSEE